MSKVAENHSLILSQIAAACQRVGRNPAEVTLVAVSKTVGAAEVALAIQAGIHDFGENRTALFEEKQQLFPEERWHFIGSIQTNKIKDFVGKAALVHSVASDRALVAIAKRAQALGVTQRLLLEVNVSGEQSKDGTGPQELDRLLDLAQGLEGIEVRGLMTMAPQADERTVRACFQALRELRDRFTVAYRGAERIFLHELSMGMSDDFPLAVEEGATIVRIGRTVWL
ncbi:MAG: YggS family pyridoxal phosphate-dependent enzyme [Coriobacteriia bacterium]|nr:YggS family pyridoxal phosphate-dependent enzyme [Coriobacteriia bacterium]